MLDPNVGAQAEKIAALTLTLRQAGTPTLAAAHHASMAFIKLERWTDLLALSRNYQAREGSQPRFAALEALALDKLGETDQARQLLERMIEGGETDTMALNAYVNILARCGFVKQAFDVAEKIMEAAKDRPRLIDSVRLAFAMAQMADPSSPRLLGLAKRMGALSDPSDEEQEGIYLQMLLTSTLDGGSSISEADRAEFQRRSQAYFETHPKSKVLTRIEVSENATGDELLQALREATGQTEERDKLRAQFAEQVRAGSTPLPFAWRPTRILADISDVVQLWEACRFPYS